MTKKHYRRKHFFINKPFQLRYMGYIVFTLVVVSTVAIVSIYMGIWSSIIKEFSDEKMREAMLTASRIREYEAARRPGEEAPKFSSLSLFKETELLSARQREVMEEILRKTNRQLMWKLTILLAFIAWGTIFLSHKIAGPIYRFDQSFKEIKDGNLSIRVKLRKFDEVKELVTSFNEMAESLDKKVARMKTVIKQTEGDRVPKTKLEESVSSFQTSDED